MKQDHSTGRWHEDGTWAWKGLKPLPPTHEELKRTGCIAVVQGLPKSIYINRPRQEPNYRFFQAIAIVFIFAAVAAVGLAVVFGWV